MIKILESYFPECQECSRPSLQLLCESCLEIFRFRNACVYCGRLRLTHEMTQCLPCRQQDWPWHKLSAAFFYDGGIRSWIYDMKEGAKPERLKELRASHLPSSLFQTKFDFLVPVAADRSRTKKRGYHFAETLAQYLGRILEAPVISSAFVRHTFLSSQKELDEYQRRKFLRYIVSLKPEFQEMLFNRRVLLIDDVMTTGASLEVHAEWLEQAGAILTAFTLARTPRYL